MSGKKDTAMENINQYMAALDLEDLKNVNSGLWQDAVRYLEELRKQYGLATLEEVMEVWTEREQFEYEMLLRQGMPRPKPDPFN